jgi:MFS family permease
MFGILSNLTYRRLFTAQILSLLGSGLTTVALGLLAFELAGADAGVVLGTALALKMVAYVGIAPIAGAFAGMVPRRTLLVALDVARATFVLFLPFISEIWQIYVLVFAFQAFSAAFTPTFQATIPDILTDEADYTKALSLSRLAYDLESLVSPMFAGLLLTVINFHWLFAGTTLGFLASALLVMSVALPAPKAVPTTAGILKRMTRGIWIYWQTPRLRGLLALNLAVAAAGSMVIVNTVVYVRTYLGLGDQDVALMFAAYGAGSMIVALALPQVLARLQSRTVMIVGAVALVVVLTIAATLPGFVLAMGVWLLLGAGTAAVMTPSGLLLRQSAHPADRPAVFAAQFALSHACWLLTYPAAGWLGASLGLSGAFLSLAAIALAGATISAVVWPRNDPSVIEHTHAETEHTHWHDHGDGHHDHLHPHASGEDAHAHAHQHQPFRHAHPFVIDDHPPAWPR